MHGGHKSYLPRDGSLRAQPAVRETLHVLPRRPCSGKEGEKKLPSRPVAKNKSFVPYRPPRRENLPRGVLSSRPVEKLYTHGPVPPRPAPPTFYVIILPSRFPFFSPRPTKSKLCSPVPSRFSVTVIRLAFLVVLGGPFQRGLFRLPAFF